MWHATETNSASTMSSSSAAALSDEPAEAATNEDDVFREVGATGSTAPTSCPGGSNAEVKSERGSFNSISVDTDIDMATPNKTSGTAAAQKTLGTEATSGPGAVTTSPVSTANKIFTSQIASASSSLPTTPTTGKRSTVDIAKTSDQEVKINLPFSLWPASSASAPAIQNTNNPNSKAIPNSGSTHSKPPLIPTPPTSVPPSPIPSPKSTISSSNSSPNPQQDQAQSQGQQPPSRLIAPRLLSTPQSNRTIKPITRVGARGNVGGSGGGGAVSDALLGGTSSSDVNSTAIPSSHRRASSEIPTLPSLSTIQGSSSNNSSMSTLNYNHDDSRISMNNHNTNTRISIVGKRDKEKERYHPTLSKLFDLDDKDCLPLLPTPRKPPKCPLFCCFYAYFDDQVGPQIGYQSPKRFMENDISISPDVVHGILEKAFTKYTDGDKRKNKKKSKKKQQQQKKESPSKTNTEEKIDPPSASQPTNPQAGGIKPFDADSRTVSEISDFNTESEVDTGMGDSSIDGDDLVDIAQEDKNIAVDGNDGDDEHDGDDDDEDEEEEAFTDDDDLPVTLPEGAMSIFDSTSEYIITGHELCDKTITLSTHGMHILSRPTVIHHERYARNSLFFSVGFVLRRAADPSPFRPLLAKLAATLRSMEVESRLLSSPKLQPQLQTILERILVSLNSPSWECNLILSPSNSLNLKLFNPPKPLATPVHDHDVPILLRRDLQLQMYDWDLAINWVILHIDGVTNARVISIKAEVDMELVRACLRVLKHHGVIAIVDMFLYTNRYEFTSRASAMLAGKEPKLLQEAVEFCVKSSRSVALPSYQMASPGSWGAGGSSGSPNGAMGPLIGRTVGSGGGGTGGSESDSSAAGAHGQQQAFSHLTNPYNSLMTQNQHQHPQGTPASFNFFGPGSFQRTSGYKFAMMAAQSLDRESTLLHVPRSKEEYRNLKLAISELYGACNRNVSFGDLWIALTAPDLKTSKASQTNSNNDETSPSLNLPLLRSMSTRNESTGTASSNFQRLGARRFTMPTKTSNSDAGSDPSDPFDLLGVSPLETMQLDALRGRTPVSGGPAFDWEEVFHRFDHRRFASFGVVHGLLERVHNYPYFPGVFPKEETQACDSSSIKTPIAKNHTHEDDFVPLDTKFQRRNSLCMRDSEHGEESDVSEESSYALAHKVASLMDGTRCDDELVCQFEKPFQQLVDLVEKFGKQKVVSIYAKAPTF